MDNVCAAIFRGFCLFVWKNTLLSFQIKMQIQKLGNLKNPENLKVGGNEK